MFNSNAGCYSLADIAAATGNNNNGNDNGWGDGNAWWIIILFLFVFCGWGNGNWGNGNNGGGAGAQGALTRGELCQDMNFADVQNGIRGISEGMNTGFANLNSTICHQQYDTASLINGVNSAMAAGFAGVDNAVCTLGYQQQMGVNTLQQAINGVNVANMQNTNALQTQLSNCCCDLRTGQMQIGNQIERANCDTNYNAATNTTAIIQNAHNDTDRILARLEAMESARKDETIADLRTKLASCGDQTTAQYIINQIRGIVSPTPVPAYPAASPCGLGNWSQAVLANNGCGCCGNNFGCGIA